MRIKSLFEKGFVCCFCGGSIADGDPKFVLITLRIPFRNKKASQELYCHDECLKQKLEPKVALSLVMLD